MRQMRSLRVLKNEISWVESNGHRAPSFRTGVRRKRSYELNSPLARPYSTERTLRRYTGDVRGKMGVWEEATLKYQIVRYILGGRAKINRFHFFPRVIGVKLFSPSPRFWAAIDNASSAKAHLKTQA